MCTTPGERPRKFFNLNKDEVSKTISNRLYWIFFEVQRSSRYMNYSSVGIEEPMVALVVCRKADSIKSILFCNKVKKISLKTSFKALDGSYRTPDVSKVIQEERD